METSVAADKENHRVAGNQVKKDRISMVPKKGTATRKTLSDISNIPSQNEDEKRESVFANHLEYIDRLHQENTALLKLIADKNKIIEMSAIELQKFRITCQKMQQQNLQLTQANSQMLADLNAGKDKLKALHHELGCMNALLKAKENQLQDNANTQTCQSNVQEVENTRCDKAGFVPQDVHGCNESYNSKRKRRAKAQSLKANAVKQVQDNESAHQQRSTTLEFEEHKAKKANSPMKPKQMQDGNREQKRLCTRRQSARFSSHEQKQEQADSLGREDVKSPFAPDKPSSDGNHDLCLRLEENHSELINGAVVDIVEETRRSSIRPMRRAAEKVQSYKEIPLNVKMRRVD